MAIATIIVSRAFIHPPYAGLAVVPLFPLLLSPFLGPVNRPLLFQLINRYLCVMPRAPMRPPTRSNPFFCLPFPASFLILNGATHCFLQPIAHALESKGRFIRSALPHLFCQLLVPDQHG